MSKPRYELEFQAWVLQRIAAREKTIKALAAETGVSRSGLYRWMERFREGGMEGLSRPPGRPRRDRRPAGPEEEVRLLRQKVGEQQMVIDFLAEACKRVGASTQPLNGSGAKSSTRRSAR